MTHSAIVELLPAPYTFVGGENPPDSWEFREKVYHEIPRRFTVEWDENETIQKITVAE